MTASDLAPLRGLILEWTVNQGDAAFWVKVYQRKGEVEKGAMAERERMTYKHCADQLSVVLSSLQETEEKDFTRNVEAALTPADQLPQRPTEVTRK